MAMVYERFGWDSKADAQSTLTEIIAQNEGTGEVFESGGSWAFRWAPPGVELNGGGGVGAAAAGTELVWGKKTRGLHGDDFNDKVITISNGLKCDPNHLMAVMAFETGRTFDPAITSAAGSGATGLIQFMPSTAKGLGTTTGKLAKMTAVQQLDWVEKYFRDTAKGRALPMLNDVYMCVLWPKAVGKLDSYALFSSPSIAYSMNKGLDINKDGKVTKAEAGNKVHKLLIEGRKPTNFG